MTDTMHEEKFEFQTEIKQLLHLLVFSLYTKKEVFIRELVSNASDALDKMRYLNLTSPEAEGKELPLEVKIEIDDKHKIISITDTGVGMTRAELTRNLGTIARSGSMEFLKRLAENKQDENINLIGQFGVGFYSVFMVASEVRVLSKSYLQDEPGQMWVSTGEGGYTIREVELDKRGTRIEIQLKEDAAEFADAARIEGIIKKYSNFVPYPIYVGEKEVNQVAALWTKSKSEVSADEYEEFYKFLTNSFEAPATTLHLASDAPLSFKAIMFLPKTNLEKLGMGKLDHGPDLYAQKVLIQHNCKDLIPDYLRFVRGVVDSEDITLNVSRETVQDNAVLRKISRYVVKKLLDHMADMLAGRREDYIKFYEEFGRILKEGVTTDYDNRERLAKLLLFNSSLSKNREELVTLKEYTDRMPEGQEAIYYLVGSDRSVLDVSPHLEMFRKKKIEVLYLYDPVDDFVLSHISEFEKKSLKSADQVSPDDLKKIKTDSGEDKEGEKKEEKPETLAFESAFDTLIARFKEILGDRVVDVKASKRLAESPCILITPSGGPSIQVQKAMSMIDSNFHMAKRVFEVNKDNSLIRNLVDINKDDSNSPLVAECCEQLFESAMLMEGILPDPSKMVPRIHKIMETASSNERREV